MNEHEYMSRDTLINELAKAQIQIGKQEVEISNYKAEILYVQGRVNEVHAWLEQALNGWAGSGEEFAQEYGELAEIVDFDMAREVQVNITWSQTVTVKVPVGEDISEQDFWANSTPDIDSNYEVLEASGLDCEDASE